MKHSLRTCTDPEALRAGCAFYRSPSRDAADKQALLASGLRLSTPVLAIGSGWTDAFGRAGEVEASRRRAATDVPGLTMEERSRFVPEEGPVLIPRTVPGHVE